MRIVIPVQTGIQTLSLPCIKHGVNSSREPFYILDPDFHREPWIPAGVYPDENRGRNDQQKNEIKAKSTSSRQDVEEPLALKARVVQSLCGKVEGGKGGDGRVH